MLIPSNALKLAFCMFVNHHLLPSHLISSNSEMAAVAGMDPKAAQNPLSSSPTQEKPELLSLTMDEIAMRGGKSVGSMNMEEFLANLWTNDDNPVPNEEAGDKVLTEGMDQEPFSVPSPLSRKKVEEVWQEITRGFAVQDDPQKELKPEQLQQQPTLGEITLEDFLVKAGVIHEGTGDPGGLISKIEASEEQVCLNDGSLGCHVVQLGEPPIGSVVGFNGVDLGRRPNKRRMFEGQSEVVGERRQRRMIKNRESAARSRARKQAYTVELEHELAHLQEENAKLTQLVAEDEKRRKMQILEKQLLTPLRLRDSKMKILRRCVSVSW